MRETVRDAEGESRGERGSRQEIGCLKQSSGFNHSLEKRKP